MFLDDRNSAEQAANAAWQAAAYTSDAAAASAVAAIGSIADASTSGIQSADEDADDVDSPLAEPHVDAETVAATAAAAAANDDASCSAAGTHGLCRQSDFSKKARSDAVELRFPDTELEAARPDDDDDDDEDEDEDEDEDVAAAWRAPMDETARSVSIDPPARLAFTSSAPANSTVAAATALLVDRVSPVSPW